MVAAARTRLIRRTLREERVSGFAPLDAGSSRVDREAGIIFGVKVVGKESPNTHGVRGAEGTVYTPSAMEQACKLYEGLKVNIDHPPREKPGAERSAEDRLGKLQKCRVLHGEIFADLHLLKTHPMAERLMEAAERMPDAFALSHNATGRGEVKNGRYVITEIPEVRSVDVVADGGTNRSLFEGLTIPKSLRTVITESKVSKTLKKSLLEMGDDYDTSMMDADLPELPAEGGGDWKADLVAAIGKLVASEDSADHDMAKKIMAMLKPGGAKPAVATEEAEEDDDKKEEDVAENEECDKKDMKESLTRKVKRRCEMVGVTADNDLLESLVAMKDEEAIDKHLLWLKKQTAPKAAEAPKRNTAPRSTSSHALQESRETKDAKFPTTADERRRLISIN